MSENTIPVPTTATERVERLRKAFLTYKPNIDIERAVFMYDLYESGELDDLSPVMVKAKLLDNLLQKKTIYIEDDQLVAGTFGSRPRAMPVYPESNGKTMINEFRKAPTREIDPFEYSDEDREKLEFVLNNMKPMPELRKVFYDELPMEMKRLFLKEPEKNYTVNTQICSMDGVINGPGGHINPDFERIVNFGFDYIIREAEVRKRQAEAEGDERAVEFLNGAIICMQAAGKFAERHAELARKLAEKETDQKRKTELLRMADACSQVPMKPARTFYECIQSTWLLFVIIMLEGSERCYSVARFDQYAYPYLQADLDSGRVTQSEAQEMLDCFWMKFTETSHFNSESFTKSIAGFAPQQQFVCGGQTRDGKDATNLLSYMQLQASINTRYAQPSISVRMWEGTPDALIGSYKQVSATLESASADAAVRAVVITGAGKHFCAGGNLNRFKEYIESGVYLQKGNIKLAGQMSASVKKCHKPVVAMINGAAAGAGCALALACDFRVMEPKSRLALSFINVGLPGDTGSMYFMQRLVGTAKTMEMMMTGKPVFGEEAYAMGLTTELAEEGNLKECTYALARRLASGATLAMARQKQLMYETFYSDMDSYMEREAEYMVECSHSADFAEAVYAFLEKRKPEFQGK